MPVNNKKSDIKRLERVAGLTIIVSLLLILLIGLTDSFITGFTVSNLGAAINPLVGLGVIGLVSIGYFFIKKLEN